MKKVDTESAKNKIHNKSSPDSVTNGLSLLDLLFILVTTVFSGVTRFYRLTEPAAVVFDEFHFGKFVTWYFTGEYFFDIHPPLGKLLLYLGGKIGKYEPGFLYDAIGAEYGDTKYFVLRSVSAIFGTLSAPVMYLLCRLFGLSVESCLLGASLVVFDFLALIESRLLLIDSQLHFFCIISLLSALCLWKSAPKTWKRFIWLIATAIFAACTVSIKWTGLATAGVIAVVSFCGVYPLSQPLYLWECAVAVIVGLVTYMIPFYVHFKMLPLSGSGDGFMKEEFQKALKGNPLYEVGSISPPFIENFIYLNKEMLRANNAITERHPWESKWYEWPLNLRGLLYFSEEMEDGSVRQIYLIGNPVVMYLCILFALAFFLSLIFYCRYRSLLTSDRELSQLLAKGLFLLMAYLLNLIPYIAVDRSAFLYHYLPGLLDAQLLVAVMIDSFPVKFRRIFIGMMSRSMEVSLKASDSENTLPSTLNDDCYTGTHTNFYEEIEKLSSMGISATDVKRMKEAGYHTISSIIMTTRKNLLLIKGLSEAKVDKVRECAYKISNSSFVSGLEVKERRKNLMHITTGSSALDDLLGGGVETSSITEVFGEFRSGKTQLAHTLCVTTQLPKNANGTEGRVAYIDTENCFRPERIVEIAERFDMDPDDVLDNILVARAYTSEHQMELLIHIAAKMVEENFGLLIVDSATALFRVDYSGRGELSERQQKLNRFMSQLLKLSEQFNLAVMITNQVMSTPDGSAGMFVADPKKPVGGHVVAHASTTRIMLRKGRGEQRVAKIYDSPMLAENEATFEVAGGGIIDVKD
eukprot:jgi/Galph1/6012/GphlegSOOS_G4658.1